MCVCVCGGGGGGGNVIMDVKSVKVYISAVNGLSTYTTKNGWYDHKS